MERTPDDRNDGHGEARGEYRVAGARYEDRRRAEQPDHGTDEPERAGAADIGRDRCFANGDPGQERDSGPKLL